MNDITTELKSITRTRKVVDSMLWAIAGGAILFSLMTGEPLVSAHSQWKWTGWVLPAVVDAALILSLSADSILSRHGVDSGRWATTFRWLTALASLFLNCWSSIELRDWVGVTVHSISPLILVCAAEVAPIYRRKFREVELNLSEQVKEFTVTRTVSRGSSQPVQSSNSGDLPARGSRIPSSLESDVSLTDNQRAIRDGFLAERKAADVAREIGVSSSYVSSQYRKIKAELELTA